MELTLFIIVGAIALVSAAMMLISENAIYSALFLILNFACIAFFFLMLNATFLAMVQITVYAGAIMVLFLFVIMLLGAERVLPADVPHARWMSPVALVLAFIFAIVAGAAILQGDITATEPQPGQPVVRVVNAVDGWGSVDVYLGERRVAHNLDYGENTRFTAADAGTVSASVFSAGDDPDTATPLLQSDLTLLDGEAVSLTAVGRTNAPGSEPALLAAAQVEDYAEKSDAVRVLVVNGDPSIPLLDVYDITDRDERRLLVDQIPYGDATEVEIPADTYDVGFYAHDSDRALLEPPLEDQELTANTAVLWVYADQRQPDNSFLPVVLTLEAFGNPVFGSPTQVGRALFSDYVLPFEMVSLLLLVAMIGAIVLTHEKLSAPRPRVARRLANPPPGLEQPIRGEPGK